jgi:hypothetical protein
MNTEIVIRRGETYVLVRVMLVARDESGNLVPLTAREVRTALALLSDQVPR